MFVDWLDMQLLNWFNVWVEMVKIIVFDLWLYIICEVCVFEKVVKKIGQMIVFIVNLVDVVWFD